MYLFLFVLQFGLFEFSFSVFWVANTSTFSDVFAPHLIMYLGFFASDLLCFDTSVYWVAHTSQVEMGNMVPPLQLFDRLGVATTRIHNQQNTQGLVQHRVYWETERAKNQKLPVFPRH
eukprot:m.82327 g.82327  ORF g.82327 m.82327 type:complete len:118 (+) comp25509_c0_seq1:469-822(+)